MVSKTKNGKLVSRRYVDECSPNATSLPRCIPRDRLFKPLPDILKDNDTTPGRIHIGRACITDYTVWHFPEQIAAIEARITDNRAPACWVDKLGVKPPPGFERKQVKRKEVDIVPALTVPCDVEKEFAKLDWERKENERKNRPRHDSGYGSDEELRLELEKKMEELEAEEKEHEEDEGTGIWESVEEEAEFSVWSCNDL